MSSPLLVALGISFALSLLPWGKYLLYPFRLFTTWAHECSHALVAILCGGTVTKITLAPDTSGITYYQLPAGRIRKAWVASAGYLGSCALGCLIFHVAHAYPARLDQLLFGLGCLMLFSVLGWMRGSFGIFATLGLAALLLGASMTRAGPGWAAFRHFFVPWLAVQTALNSLFDLRVLFGLNSRTRSDAQLMSKIFWLPSAFWACAWIGLSIGMMSLTLKIDGLI